MPLDQGRVAKVGEEKIQRQEGGHSDTARAAFCTGDISRKKPKAFWGHSSVH